MAFVENAFDPIGVLEYQPFLNSLFVIGAGHVTATLIQLASTILVDHTT
jgi:hypothetical protein